MTQKIIFAFTGLIASGKGTACDFFIQKYGAKLLRYSTPLRDILTRLYLPESRENMQKLSTMLREGFGQDILTRILLRDIESSSDTFFILDGVRRPEELVPLKNLGGFTLVAIDAPAKIRYQRLIKRRENPDDEKKTWEQFLKEERVEADKRIPEVMRLADVTIDNTKDTRAFYTQLEQLYTKIKHGN